MSVRLVAIASLFAFLLCHSNSASAQTVNDTYAEIQGSQFTCNVNNPSDQTCVHDVNIAPAINQSASAGIMFNQSSMPTGTAKSIDAAGAAWPGSLYGHLKLTRGAASHSDIMGPGATVTMHRVTVFPNPSPNLGNFQYLTLDLNGTIDPILHNVGDGSASATLRVDVHWHKRNNSPLDVSSGAQCSGTASPDNCFYGYFETTQFGDGYAITVNSQPVTQTTQRGRVLYQAEITAAAGFDLVFVYTLTLNATLPTDNAAASVDMEYEHTANVYLDAVDPANTLVSSDGHDYSDPGGRKAELVVKSMTPAGVGVGLTLAPDLNYKILSGGVQLPAGSSHRLVASRPNVPPAGNAPPSWSPSWLTGDIDPSAFALQRTAATAYVLQLKDPEDFTSRYRLTVTESSSSSLFRTRPVAVAVVPPGYTLTGGGCRLNAPPPAQGSGGSVKKTIAQEPKIFITGSYPVVESNGVQEWICESQVQALHFPAGIITAYAVGILDTATIAPVPMVITKDSSTAVSQPSATAALAPGGLLISGCGARVEPSWAMLGPLNFPIDDQVLTAMYPLTAAGSPDGPATGCQANASAYGISALGIVDAYAVNLLLDHAILENIIPDYAPVGSTVALQGSHFHLPVTVLFSCQGTETTAMSLPTTWPRETGVKVPTGLQPGFCDVGIQQAGLPNLVSPDLGMVVQ
jgi:hypothetical protein